MLPIYTTYDVIHYAEAEITNWKTPKYSSSGRYLKSLWEKGLHYGLICGKTHLKVVFVSGLHELVKFTMRA